MRKLFFSFLVVFISSTSPLKANAKAPCKLNNQTTLSLQAEIKKDLIDCVKSLDISKLETVILNSGGGDVEAAMAVGDMIAPYRPHMIIKKRCHSSCSNYWLPLARKITFSKKARILIHGGIDQGMIKLMKDREQNGVDKIQRIVDLQGDYIRRHKIPRGWVMYRTDYTKGNDAFAPWLVGDVAVPVTAEKITIKLYVVSEPILRSCLPDVELKGFENSYAARVDNKHWLKLAKKGQLSTGTLTCSSTEQ